MTQEALLDAVAVEVNPVVDAVRAGLTAPHKWLPPWLFYDAAGSELFERITELPEYYPTRTERALFVQHAKDMLECAATLLPEQKPLRMLELGAGSASKTGVLLRAAVERQGRCTYLPIDVSESALEYACETLGRTLGTVQVVPQVANYVTDALAIPIYDGPTLALYIGSSIGNFEPADAVAVLRNLRAQLRPGDSLLLGTDLAKSPDVLLAAYDDAAGVTAAFNKNMLRRLNRELGSDFNVDCFTHRAVWNAGESRIEMHLESVREQVVHIAGLRVEFAEGETIHTENSYKFTEGAIASLLENAGFEAVRTWQDEQKWFAVTLAAVA